MKALARSPFWSFVRQEVRLAVRSRWTVAFAIVFAALSLLVSAAGFILTGGQGLQDLARTAASLVELVVLLVPLASLVFGVMALTPDPGAAELLFSQPIARRTILGARLMGLWLALVGAEALGFGASGLVLFARTGAGGLGSFLGVMAASFLLTAVFLCLAAALAAGGTSRGRARSLALSLVVWCGAVLLYDAAALAVASLLPSGLASRVLVAAALANPVDAIRTGTLMAIEGTAAFGTASLALLRFTSGATGAAFWLLLSVLVWIAAPFGVAAVRLKRADI
jgi:Cu-processing system permease protein